MATEVSLSGGVEFVGLAFVVCQCCLELPKGLVEPCTLSRRPHRRASYPPAIGLARAAMNNARHPHSPGSRRHVCNNAGPSSAGACVVFELVGAMQERLETALVYCSNAVVALATIY